MNKHLPVSPPPIHIIPPPVQDFVGREGLIKTLVQVFTPTENDLAQSGKCSAHQLLGSLQGVYIVNYAHQQKDAGLP